jgi:heterodisulfide reductase subunit D
MLYFRGCVVREKLPNIEVATKKILDKAQVDYHILENEGCCGSFLLRTGFTEDAREVMTNALQDLRDQKIVVSCAGCYNTLKNDYKNLLGVELDVIHISQLFRDLISEGILKPEKTDLKVCYHDPCHLGRHCGEYQAPRDVLNSAAQVVEMEREKDKSRCCGAGGGVKSAFPETAIKLARKRIEDARDTDADILVTSCSFCLINLSSAYENSKKDKKDVLPVKDLSEILLWALEIKSEK